MLQKIYLLFIFLQHNKLQIARYYYKITFLKKGKKGVKCICSSKKNYCTKFFLFQSKWQ